MNGTADLYVSLHHDAFGIEVILLSADRLPTVLNNAVLVKVISIAIDGDPSETLHSVSAKIVLLGLYRVETGCHYAGGGLEIVRFPADLFPLSISGSVGSKVILVAIISNPACLHDAGGSIEEVEVISDLVQSFDHISTVIKVVSVAVDRLEASFYTCSIRIYIILACAVSLKSAAIRRRRRGCAGSAKLDRTCFLEAPVGPCRVIKVFGV